MKTFDRVYLPLGWTIFIQILLCLPGSVFPDETSPISQVPQFDKLIHIIFFGFFIVSWSLFYSRRTQSYTRLKLILFYIFLAGAANGIVIEYVQFYFIPNRSFDEGDIIADLLSCGVFYGLCNVKLLTCEQKAPRI